MQAEAGREATQGGNSPDLLADQSLDDLEVPSELPSQWGPAHVGGETPLRGLLPGEPRVPAPYPLGISSQLSGQGSFCASAWAVTQPFSVTQRQKHPG